jgi:hypothetical protein
MFMGTYGDVRFTEDGQPILIPMASDGSSLDPWNPKATPRPWMMRAPRASYAGRKWELIKPTPDIKPPPPIRKKKYLYKASVSLKENLRRIKQRLKKDKKYLTS